MLSPTFPIELLAADKQLMPGINVSLKFQMVIVSFILIPLTRSSISNCAEIESCLRIFTIKTECAGFAELTSQKALLPPQEQASTLLS
tara:strand:+ start:25464 stop:25727 length:264 start_codon:yes stop_codon:yes gene_type:complete